MSTLIAVPSEAPGGLDAYLSLHFGHCDVFTLVKLDDDGSIETSVVPAPDHDVSGCMGPVRLLASHGVSVITAAGMGPRPLMGFLENGIRPYHTGGCDTVGEAVAAFAAGALPAFGAERICAGHEEGEACCSGHDH